MDFFSNMTTRYFKQEAISAYTPWYAYTTIT